MKFTLDARPGINLIRGYGPGEVRVNEQIIHSNCIITADTLMTDWNATDPQSLTAEALEPLLALQADVVLLGTGNTQKFPPASIRQLFAGRRIGLEAMDLGAACRTFNILVQEERRVAAALFVNEPHK